MPQENSGEKVDSRGFKIVPVNEEAMRVWREAKNREAPEPGLTKEQLDAKEKSEAEKRRAWTDFASNQKNNK